MPTLNCPQPYNVSCSTAAADAFKTWLLQNGYVKNKLPAIRQFFRDVKAGHWARRNRPMPDKPSQKRKIDTHLSIDLDCWQHLSRGIASRYHDDPSCFLLDIADGNWKRISQ